MSHRNPHGSTGDQSLLLPESRFSSVLQLDQPSGRSSSSIDLSRVDSPEDERRAVVLSTQSEAARRLGARQLIPKNLAVSSRPRNRHHTTVVTLPTDLSWEDYDSDSGAGFSMRRNRRNKSYRAAVTSLNLDALPSELQTEVLTPVSEEKTANQKTLGRIRNRKETGSFKDEPRFYQEIKERGLNASSLNTEEDECSLTEPPEENQGIVVKNYRAAYMTWSQLPKVKDLGVLDIISPEERKRQEAIFEIMTSEYSYLHSLSILVSHFKDSTDLKKTMTTTEHHHLFSNISVIQDVSKRFFEDLDMRHQIHPLIQDISDIVNKYATQHFEPYIVYCSNETFQQRTLQKLLSSNNAFRETLKEIEGSEACGGLPMISFLILPMQRITRLPLLLDTICQKTPKETAEYFAACWAFKAISKLVKRCNDGARTMERTEQMYTIQKQMEFGKIKPFPLVSSSRWLKKSGELALYTDDLSIFRKAFIFKNLPQYEATKAYMPKAPDELSLQQAELVIVSQEVEGWCHGERMRDGERGWFPANCATQITNRTAMENNIQRMERLRKETDV
uniref:Rho guanine nucleotide exchange factor (GEF) 16 n=1 Tax=Cyprinus carpio TaxID=7962 RepID=A0A8C1Q319_CYPCA